MRSVVVIEAGLREPSSTSMLGERLAESTRTAFDAAGEQVEITTVHLREYFPDIGQAFSSFAPSRLREVFVTAYGVPAKTFPARLPLLALDRIYVRNASVLTPVTLPRKPWDRLSDHAPLAAEIAL